MSFVRKGLLVSGGQMVTLFLSLLVGVLYARSLGPDGMGQYELFRSTALVATTLLAMGLGNASVYLINNVKTPVSAVVSSTLKGGLGLGIILVAVLTVILLAFPGYFGRIPGWTAVVFSAGVAAHLLMLLLRGALLAKLAARQMVIQDISMYVSVLAGGGILVFAGWLTPVTALILLSAGFSLQAGVSLWFLRNDIKLVLPIDWQLLRRLLAYGLVFSAANLLLILGAQITLFLLRYLRAETFADVGLYTRAMAIGTMALLIPRAVGPMLYAKWASVQGATRTSQVEMTLRVNLAYGVAMAVAVLVAGRYLLVLLYGSEFVAAQNALQILAVAMVFPTLFGPLNQLVSSDGKAALTAWVLAGTLVVITAVTMATVPAMGIRGAAIGALAGNLFTFAGLAVACRKLYGVRLLHCLLIRPEDIHYVLSSLSGRKKLPSPGGTIAGK